MPVSGGHGTAVPGVRHVADGAGADAAFSYNPVAFFSFPAWFLISIGAFIGRPKALRHSKNLLRILYINITVYMIFAVVRNLVVLL